MTSKQTLQERFDEFFWNEEYDGTAQEIFDFYKSELLALRTALLEKRIMIAGLESGLNYRAVKAEDIEAAFKELGI